MSFLSSLFPRCAAVDLQKDVAGMPLAPEWQPLIRPQAQYIVSYPRSGNRWARTMLFDLTSEAPTDAARHASLRFFFPDLHVAPDASQVTHFAGDHSQYLKSHNLRALLDRRMVYLFRQAPDALVSLFHFRQLWASWQKPLQALGIDAFCLEMIGSWCDHLTLALECQRADPSRVLFVSFEAMKAAPAEHLRRMVAFLGMAADEASIQRAVEENTFQKSQQRLEGHQVQDRGTLLRQGAVGGGAAELRDDTRAKILEATNALYAEASARMTAG